MFWACSSTLRLFVLLNGPSEKLLLEWRFDIFRVMVHLLTVMLCLRGRKYLSISLWYLHRSLGVTHSFLVLMVFASLAGIFPVWCFIRQKNVGAELTRIWHEVGILQERWLEMRTKAFHSLKDFLRDYFENRQCEKHLKHGLRPFNTNP